MKKFAKIALIGFLIVIIGGGTTGAIYYYNLTQSPDDNNGNNGTNGELDLNFDTLVWSDEFNYTGLPDPTKWNFELGANGWGNHEEQNYVKRWENSRVENGTLTIEARKDNFDGLPYSSARITTQYKAKWTYGRIEARAKLPGGVGIWAAIWMMPEKSVYGQWPNSGEIDIMEYVGFTPTYIYGTTHTAANYGGNGLSGSVKIDDCESSFHVYKIEWYPTGIYFYVDDNLFHRVDNPNDGNYETWPFDQDFFLILNLAVGGDWGGAQGVDDSIFPQQMVVDYVRVYK